MSNSLTTVVNQLLTESLRQLIRLAFRRVNLLDDILHVIHDRRIDPVHDCNTAIGDLAVDGGEAAEDDVVEHHESVLADPVPRRVEVASLEGVEDGLNTVEVGVAVLASDAVDAGLESGDVCLLLVVSNLASTRVALMVAHVQLDVLSGELLLRGLELQEFFAVDDGTASASSTSTGSGARRKRDAGALGVDGDDGIHPRFTLSLRPETLRRFHSTPRRRAASARAGPKPQGPFM